jgi:polar amino acid transport system substrate-binding protein
MNIRTVWYTALFTSCLLLSQSALADPILDHVNDTGRVRIGFTYNAPPMGYIDDSGQWVGFDLDLGNELSKRLGVKVDAVKVNDDTRIAYLASGRIDMAIAHMSETRSREQQIDFAFPPYLWTCKVFYSKKDRFNSVADLGGKRIGVAQGSNAFTAGQEEIARFSSVPAKMVSFQNNADAFLALKQGKIDAYTQDTPIIAAVAGSAGVDFSPVGKCYSPGLYGIGVPPNHKDWRVAVSLALQDLIKDGTYEKLYTHWFGPNGKAPLPVNARPRLPEDSFGNMSLIWPD